MKKNVAMAWIDNKKAYDMILKTWIIKCLKMSKISEEAMNLILKAMENLRVEVMAVGQTLVKVETTKERKIFNHENMGVLGGKENYKYLGIIEANTNKQMEMKEKVRKEYL